MKMLDILEKDKDHLLTELTRAGVPERAAVRECLRHGPRRLRTVGFSGAGLVGRLGGEEQAKDSNATSSTITVCKRQ